MELYVEKGKDFEKIVGDEVTSGDQIRSRLESLFNKSYTSLEEVRKEIHGTNGEGNLSFPPSIKVPARMSVVLDNLPQIVLEVPILYTSYKDFEVARIKVRGEVHCD
jgi:hypothetical protein